MTDVWVPVDARRAHHPRVGQRPVHPPHRVDHRGSFQRMPATSSRKQHHGDTGDRRDDHRDRSHAERTDMGTHGNRP